MKTRRLVGILPPKSENIPKRTEIHNSFILRRLEVADVDIQAVEAKVIEIVSEQMGVDKGEISRETSFINDLNADSLDTV